MKRASNGGAGLTAKLATSTTAAPMKARAKDRMNARQDDPAKTGGNPKAPPKSGFPFAASIKNVLSGDEGEDDLVLEGPAARAKGARASNTIATPSRLWCRRPKQETGPRGSTTHCVGTAFHRGDEDYAPPGSTSNRQADNPQCREHRSRRCLPKPMRKRAHAEVLPILFGAGIPLGG